MFSTSFVGVTFNIEETSAISYKGNTLYVGGSGPGNYSKIQDAIDEANVCDVVFVYDEASPYYENLIINRTMRLLGENKKTTIIDGMKEKDVIFVSAQDVNISGFTIQNSKQGCSGIHCTSNSNIIHDNIFTSNFIGLCVDDSSQNHIITENIFVENLDGIVFIGNSRNNQISHCYFQNNTGGICFFEKHRNSEVAYCQFFGNKHDIELERRVFFNRISCNNFLGDGIIRHWMILFIFNFYNSNYWHDWIGIGPYHIHGLFCWDWHPAKEPYDI